jgi:hypothetical protein
MALHSEYEGANLHQPARADATDPGAIGAHKAWYQPSTGILRIRNADNNGWDLVARRPTVTVSVSATHTVALADWQAFVWLEDASEVTVTVPEDASDDLPVGFTALYGQADDGPLTFVPESSEPAIHSLNLSDTTTGMGAVVRLTKVAADQWVLSGDLMESS